MPAPEMNCSADFQTDEDPVVAFGDFRLLAQRLRCCPLRSLRLVDLGLERCEEPLQAMECPGPVLGFATLTYLAIGSFWRCVPALVAEAAKHLCYATSLQTLDLSHGNLTGYSMPDLASALAQLTGLTKLDLRSHDLTGGCLRLLAALKCGPLVATTVAADEQCLDARTCGDMLSVEESASARRARSGWQ